MKKALVIYNPVSGSKSWKDVPRIVKDELKKNDYQYTWFETEPVKKQPLEPFIKKRFDRIIIIGGDGTVAEVASFIIENKIKTPLVIIPQGSGNLLARTLKLPLLNIRHAVRLGLTKPGKPLDAMFVNKKIHGLIAAGCGYDVIMMKHTTRSLKRKFGLLAYGLTFFKTFFVYRSKPYRITIDKKRYHLMAKTILVFNLLPLSNLRITRHLIPEKIDPSDGKLNIVAFNPRSLWNLLSRKPKVQTFTGRSITIKPRKSKHFEVDGDVYRGKTVQVEIIPKAIQIVRT